MMIDQPRNVLIAVAFALSVISQLEAQDRWPQFRGAQSRGISVESISPDGSASDSKLPEQWSTTHNIAWKKDIPGRGWSLALATEIEPFFGWLVSFRVYDGR